MLEAAWSLGYDVDGWRAHCNGLTWPEVLRQMMVAAGKVRPAGWRAFDSRPHQTCFFLGHGNLQGRRYCLPNRDESGNVTKRIRAKSMDDVDPEEWAEGRLKLRRPLRLNAGSIKAAVWTVLSTAGPDGLTLSEMSRRITARQDAGGEAFMTLSGGRHPAGLYA